MAVAEVRNIETLATVEAVRAGVGVACFWSQAVDISCVAVVLKVLPASPSLAAP